MTLLLKIARFWLILVAALFCGYVAVYNKEPITLALPPWIDHVTVPAYTGLAAAFLGGATLALVAFSTELLVKTLKIRRLSRQVKDLKAALPRPASASTSAAPTTLGRSRLGRGTLGANEPSADGPTAGPLP
jgi:uncharacterized integral membrane protein